MSKVTHATYRDATNREKTWCGLLVDRGMSTTNAWAHSDCYDCIAAGAAANRTMPMRMLEQGVVVPPLTDDEIEAAIASITGHHTGHHAHVYVCRECGRPANE